MSKIARLFGQDPELASEAPEIDIFFADDARQREPRRPGMEHRELIAIGGFSIGAEEVGPLSGSIDTLCDQTGFPANEEFKWSPPPDSWMAGSVRTRAASRRNRPAGMRARIPVPQTAGETESA
jgi:hypothetical protein